MTRERPGAVLAAALIAGVSYTVMPHGLDPVLAVAWKGAGVSLLAVWCAVKVRSLDGWLITAVMACGALGDVLLEAAGVSVGAVAFAAGHVIAMLLNFRNLRPRPTVSQRLLAAMVVPFGVAIAAMCVPPDQVVPVAAYAVLVAGMAASAWISRFPRYRTGVGAMMFLASDLLIFARMGPLAASAVPGLLIWPLYFAGQALIAWGVVRTLTTDAGVGRVASA